jgi:hypothetical protein
MVELNSKIKHKKSELIYVHAFFQTLPFANLKMAGPEPKSKNNIAHRIVFQYLCGLIQKNEGFSRNRSRIF